MSVENKILTLLALERLEQNKAQRVIECIKVLKGDCVNKWCRKYWPIFNKGEEEDE